MMEEATLLDMEGSRMKRRHYPSLSPPEKDHFDDKFNRTELYMGRKRSSTTSVSDIATRHYELASRQESISPSRCMRLCCLNKTSKWSPSPDKRERSTPSRGKRSTSFSLEINAMYGSSSDDSDSEMGRREWLPSSSKYADNSNLGCRKNRSTRYDSSDFDTKLNKNERVDYRKYRSCSSSSSDSASPIKNTKQVNSGRRSPPTSRSFSSSEITFSASYGGCSSSELSSSQILFETKHRKASSPENIYYSEFIGNTSSSSSSEREIYSRSNDKNRPWRPSGKASCTRSTEKKSAYNSNRDGRCALLPAKAITTEDNTSRRHGRASNVKRKHNARDRDGVKVEVTVKRKRSSNSSSSRNTTNEYDDSENVEQLPKRRQLSKYDNDLQTDTNKISMKAKVHSVVVGPKKSPTGTRKDKQDCQFQTDSQSNGKHKQRYLRDHHLLQNCCAHSDEAVSNFTKRYEGDDIKPFSVHSERKDQFGSASGRQYYSQQLVSSNTPSGHHIEGSPRFSSPLFTNKLSPQPSLRGLDQPHPWALDLLARSQTYNGTFIDSHCHIDLLYDRLGLSHSTRFSEFRKMVAHSFPGNFEGCVAVFCYPKTYDPINPQNQLFATLAQEDGVWFAIGCHPKSATEFTPRHEQGLRKALKQSKVVALGEIGLDYSGTFYRHAETQKTVLRTQLKIALEMNLPLVLHCRDAYDDCLAILMEMVPRSWPIHLHCFCGNPDTANLWLETFPNLYIGLTPVITYTTAHGSINTARNIPLNRLLLETDSPYFVPGNIPKGRSSVSHPGFALFTAERIAELKKVSVDTVLKACRMNTYNVYGI